MEHIIVKTGPTFTAELLAAGLGGLPISTDGAGVLVGDITAAQRAALDAVIAAHDPARDTAPVIALPVIDLYRKMTDAEYAAMVQGVATQSPRVQGIFARADTFRSDAPEWPLLVRMANQLYGEARAAELLTP